MSGGRVVVITGASGGIGAALAKRLGRDNYKIVLGARREPELRSVATEIEESGGVAEVVRTDVTQRDQVFALRDAALRAFGHVDVWVNNAGRGITRPVLELTDQDIDEMVAINIKAAMYGMQAAIPHFIERGHGHLINVSTFLGRVPVATFRSMYSAAKAALNSLTANVRMDLRRTHPHIHVSLVMPGVVRTDFAVNAKTPEEIRPDMPGNARGGPPIQMPDEVADQITALIENPVAEMYTNPGSEQMARDYLADVSAFEARMAQRSSR